MKNKLEKISIVILNYNGFKYLKRTIPPLIKLNYENYEIIIIDNNSNDKSIDFIKKNKKIKLLRNKKNFGYSKGKNSGIINATGKYILLLDEDILIKDQNILNKLLKEYSELQKPGFLSILLSQYKNPYTTLYGGFSLYETMSQKKIKYNSLFNKETFQSITPDGGALFFKKELFLKLGMYDTSQPYYIDVGDIGLRSRIKGYKNYVFCKSKVIHLGIERKTNNKIWCWKYKYTFSGYYKTILKNYSLKKLLPTIFILYLFFILKTIKQTLERKTYRVITSFIQSNVILLRDLKKTLKKRKQIQKNRLKTDYFLNIKPPKIKK